MEMSAADHRHWNQRAAGQEVKREAIRRDVELLVLPTAQALSALNDNVPETNAILHVTCTVAKDLQTADLVQPGFWSVEGGSSGSVIKSAQQEGPMLSRLTLPTLFLASALVFTAQGQLASAQKAYAARVIPRTSDGHPDLGGVWMNDTATPLERPKELEGRPLLTDDEVAELNRRAKRIFSSGASDAAGPDAFFLSALRNVELYKSGGATDSSERVLQFKIDNRTSLITDPPDGKVPPYTEDGKRRVAAYRVARSGRGNPSGPKEVALGDRCITFGIPRVSGEYAAGLYGFFQIVQTRDQVLYYAEAIHDSRIIPTDGRPHLPADIRSWDGDSRGHWENDTLVVDTTNFRDQLNSYGFSEDLHLVERFTRVAPDELQYQATFDDPSTWTRTWTAMVRLKRSDQHLYEFACHEGNEEIMKTILSGSRPSER